MEDEFHEMDDLPTHVQAEEDPEGEEETSFIENASLEDEDNVISGPEVIISEERTRRIRRGFNHKNAEDFFTNILDLEPQCSDIKFVDYLIDSEVISIKREFSESGLIIDYSVRYLGWDFKSIGRVLTEDDTDLLRYGIRLYYDEWTEKERNKILKKAGIATAIGLGVIALITELSVGLTRKGADIVHQARKWEKLTPAKKISGKSIPRTALEKATGKVVIFTGEHIVIIITLVGIFLYEK